MGHDAGSSRRCLECGKEELSASVISYRTQVKHDGSLYLLSIPALHVLKCGACGDFLFDDETDGQISAALRAHLGLLSPQTIRGTLRRLGLTQKEFSERSCIAPETLSRWLSGERIQSRAYDKLIRFVIEREEAQLRAASAAELTMGELSPWPNPAPYSFPARYIRAPEDNRDVLGSENIYLALAA